MATHPSFGTEGGVELSTYRPEDAIAVVSRGGGEEKTEYDFEFPFFNPPPSAPEKFIMGAATAPEESPGRSHQKTLILGVGTWAVLGLVLLCARKFRAGAGQYASREVRKGRRKHKRGGGKQSCSSARGASVGHSHEHDDLVNDDEEGAQ